MFMSGCSILYYHVAVKVIQDLPISLGDSQSRSYLDYNSRFCFVPIECQSVAHYATYFPICYEPTVSGTLLC